MNKVNNVVRNSHPRHESLAKALGTAQYTDDLEFSDMTYGMILRSPYSNAKVKKINTSKAMKIPGVFGILTPADVPDRLFNCSGNPPSSLIVPDERVLTDHPLCLGDRICAVVADSFRTCELALREIEIDYEILPAVTDIDSALKDSAPILQPKINPDKNIMKTLVFKQGDIEEGFKTADHIFEGNFYTQPVAHVAMEPTGCVCLWDYNDKITIWSPSQTLYQERRILAEILDIDENNIRIIKPTMGGGFGARQQLQNQHVGVLLSKIVRKPVKLMNTREEDMYASATRHETKFTIKIGIKHDGTITTAYIENYLNGGPYITHTTTVCAAAGKKFQYNAKNYLYEGISVYTNSPTAGAMRGYGNLQVVVGREIMLERIARKLEMDPVEYRLKNHVGVGDEFPAAGYSISSCGIEECAEKAKIIKSCVDKEKPLRNDDEVSEGWGTAFSCHSSGPSNLDGMSSAVIMANDDGTVILSIGSADIGQGSETVMQQIVAETLGLKINQVSVNAADTDATPYDTGTFASGQTFVCGNAVVEACNDIKGKLLEALANYYEVDKSNISLKDDLYTVILNDRENKILTFREGVKIVAFGMKGKVLIGSGSYKATSSPPPFAVAHARVSYNRHFNTIEVTDIIEVADVGTAINPEAVRGQIEGGVSMGFGYAMMENIEHSRFAKKTPTTGLLDYKVPLSVDMPTIYADFAKSSYEPTGPLGAKSVGELAAIPIAPAIVNAVETVTGKEYDRIPLSGVFMPKAHRINSEGKEVER